MLDLRLFFPPNARVLVFPNSRSPRLYLAARSPLQRWDESSLYPASRFGAKFYRLSLRLRAAIGVASVRTVHSSGWPLGEFVKDVMPQLASVVVLVGTLGPAQHITVQLRDRKGWILGYLRYAEKEAARKRLRQEHLILSSLPESIGPKPVIYGMLGNGEALLKSAILGKQLRSVLPPPEALISFLESFPESPCVPLEAHPWVRQRRQDCRIPEFDEWIEHLAGKSWPVTMQHGDFTPWNLLRLSDGTLRAIDWEYGALEGFPYLDLAHYILQTLGLIYRRSPLEASRETSTYLSWQSVFALSGAEAQALTRLAAYDAYRKVSDDGQRPDAGLQPWRRSIWKDRESGSRKFSFPSSSARQSRPLN